MHVGIQGHLDSSISNFRKDIAVCSFIHGKGLISSTSKRQTFLDKSRSICSYSCPRRSTRSKMLGPFGT